MYKHFKALKIIIFLFTIFLIFAFTPPQIFQADDEQPKTEEYVFRRSWGGEGDKLNRPTGVALSPDGSKLYVSNNHRITVINRLDQTYTIWGSLGSQDGQFSCPESVAVSNSGEVYIADRCNSRIQKLSPDGTFILKWGQLGNSDGEFWNLYGIALDSNGNVYAADINGVQKFTPEGIFLGRLITRAANYVFVSLNGNIYISTNTSIFMYDPNGIEIMSFNVDGFSTANVLGISVDKNGYIYASEFTNDSIHKYDSTGRLILKWGTFGDGNNQFYDPIGLLIDDGGDVYVADSGNGRISKFDNNGNYITKWGYESRSGQLDFPLAIASDLNGSIYVTEPNIGRVQKFDGFGSFINQWGSIGTDDGQFRSIYGIATDPFGHVFVTDNGDRLQNFSNTGEFLSKWYFEPNRSSPAIASDNTGNIYILCGSLTDKCSKAVKIYNASGELINEWGEYGSGDGNFDGPTGISINSNGFVYVADSDQNKIQKFDPNGNFVFSWGTFGSGEGQFNYFLHIAIDNDDYVYVTDTGNYRFQKFTSSGEFLTQWAIPNIPPTIFTGYEITVDSDKNVYVTDGLNQRILVFNNGFAPIDPMSGLIQNGLFEQNPVLTDWTHGGSLSVLQSTHATQGDYSIQLGQPVAQTGQGLSKSWAQQTLFIDPTYNRPVLSFKYNMFVNDIMDYSDFFVSIQDGYGENHLATVVRDGYQPCSPRVAPIADTDLGWRSVTYDLSAFKGLYIRLVFSNRNLWPDSWGIWTYVDDVRVLDAGSLPIPVGDNQIYLPAISNQRCDVPTSKNIVNFIHTTELFRPSNP